jgi:transposase-like protein
MLEPVAPRRMVRDAGATMPDPEVRQRPVRRTFTAEYKLRIVEEANATREPGGVVALLRREGLYSSHLVEWRRLYRLGALHNLAHPRGRPPGNPLAAENEQLRRRVARLEARLGQAERIIEIQGKVSELLGIPLAQRSDDDPSGS